MRNQTFFPVILLVLFIWNSRLNNWFFGYPGRGFALVPDVGTGAGQVAWVDPVRLIFLSRGDLRLRPIAGESILIDNDVSEYDFRTR